ncbi:hypothetical protein [Natroniella sp. ANB-PHB2]|uniref:hypothetical protein n=1 Tax=Natroniella sp. ANB-PHB2 TaxID=3384444 RepID=UPI0038D49FE0
MNSSLILSLVGIMISLYTIANESKKRNIRFKFSIISYILLILMIGSFFISIIFEGYFKIKQNEMVFDFIGFNLIYSYWYSMLGLLLLILISGYFAYLIFNNKIKKEIEFIKSLRKNFNNDQIGLIIADLDLFFQNLMKKYLPNGRKAEENNTVRILKNEEPLSKSKILKNKIYNLWNTNKIKFSSEFNSLFSDLLKNNLFISKLIKESPYLGAKIINSNIKTRLKKEFVEDFLKELLLDNESVLYTQIKNNQNLYQLSRYRIYSENYLLYALFSNIKIANELEVWKPIGEGAIEYIQNTNNNVEKSFVVDYEEKCFESPVFVAIRFFDIMVKEALVNNFSSTMHLHYYHHFTDNIVKNIEYPDEKKGEFANLYEYYLYVIFDNYRNWIKFIFQNDVDYKISLKRVNNEYEGGNIIKNSIISMTESMDSIANSKIREKFKKYLFNISIKLYCDLMLDFNEQAEKYGQVLLRCVISKINKWDGKNIKLQDVLLNTLEDFDRIPIVFKNNGKDVLEEFENQIQSNS